MYDNKFHFSSFMTHMLSVTPRYSEIAFCLALSSVLFLIYLWKNSTLYLSFARAAYAAHNFTSYQGTCSPVYV